MESSNNKDEDLASMISHFACSLADKPGDESLLNTVVDLYQANSTRAKLSSDVMTDLAKIFFQSRRWDLFKEIISDDNAELSPDVFKWVKDKLLSESESFSFEDIQEE